MGMLTISVFSISCFLLSSAKGWFSLTFSFFCMRMAGQAALNMCCTYVINKWWVKKRGRVTGMSAFFTSVVGTAVFPILLAYSNSKMGWRNTYRCYGVYLMSVLCPLWFFIIRDTPERIGQLPDGE